MSVGMLGETIIASLIAALALTSAADEVSVDFDAKQGVVKPVNGVGQPPLLGWDDVSMFHYLKEAGIPYSRLHDVGGAFGKNLYVDIPNVFRDFDADETKSENYDFAFTDKLISALVENGVEPYYRLGVTIENAAGRGMPAYRIHPPKDYAKWARICEHVIRHYTEGWANGFHHKITRWEIWNEPENFETIEKNQMWKAPFSEYLKLYAVASRHLKAKFPHLQIGGYAGCGFYGVASWWAKPDEPRIRFLMQSFTDFLEFVRKEKLPLDFFSYHCYDAPQFAARQFAFARQKLDEYGFTNTLTSCNEWLTAPQTLAMTGTAKQAADIAAMLAVMQESPLDDAAIYDAKCGVSAYGPLFHPMTFKPHKAYWSFVAFNELRKLGVSVKSSVSDAEVFVTAARNEGGNGAVLIANTSNRKVPLKLNLGGWQLVSCRLIDKDRTYECASLPDELTPTSVCLVETKRDDVLLPNPISKGDAADPFVTYDKVTGYYYGMCTESHAVVLRRARQISQLFDEGGLKKVIFRTNAVDGVYGCIWAPEMHKAPDGKWYVYTSGNTNPDPKGPWDLRIFALQSKTSDPYDGFVFKGVLDPDTRAIDPTVWTDGCGRQYMCYSFCIDGGQRLGIRRMRNPWTFEGPHVDIAKAELPWEMTWSEQSIVEGPFFLVSEGRLFIVYSANGCWNDDYALGVLEHTGGDILSATQWKKHEKPLLVKGNGVFGPGHASFFHSPDGTEVWCAYHGMNKSNPKHEPTTRYCHIQKVNFTKDGFPVMGTAIGASK